MEKIRNQRARPSIRVTSETVDLYLPPNGSFPRNFCFDSLAVAGKGRTGVADSLVPQAWVGGLGRHG